MNAITPVRLAATIVTLVTINFVACDLSGQEARHSKPDKPIRVTTAAFRIDVDLPSAEVALLKRIEIPTDAQLGLAVQNGSVAEWQKISATEK